jgi:hypothetical protein
MNLNSDERWSTYKEVLAESQDKALELFSIKKVSSRTHLDLNRSASPVHGRSELGLVAISNKPTILKFPKVGETWRILQYVLRPSRHA